METLDWKPYQILPWYPHMGPNDRTIWERFIRAYPDVFWKVAYDVKVGEGLHQSHFEAHGLHKNENNLYQRKIDVVGYASDVITIVEVKPRASTAAVGQVKGYGTLFRRDHNYTGMLRLLIVTDHLLPEMEFLARGEGVEIIVV